MKITETVTETEKSDSIKTYKNNTNWKICKRENQSSST